MKGVLFDAIPWVCITGLVIIAITEVVRMAKNTDRYDGYERILRQRTMERLGFDLDTLPPPIMQGLRRDFVQDIRHGVANRDLWPRFDARLDDELGVEVVGKLLKRKRQAKKE